MHESASPTAPRRRLRGPLAALLCCALMALAACGGGSDDNAAPAPGAGGGTGGGTGGGSTGTGLVVDANPLRATVVPDTARSVTQTVPLAGGSIVATGADGALYTLTVPADALLAPTDITVTPLASLSVADLPANAAYGVQLGPDGARFSNFVTLTITPPPGTSAPIDQQIPIGWAGEQNVVALASLDKTSREVHLKLLHFSGYALLLARNGTNATLEPARHRLGGDAEARLTSATAERLLQERQRQLAGQPATDLETVLGDLMRQYDEEVLKPRLAAAGSSCAAGRLAVQTLLGRTRQRQLMGLPDDALSDAATFGTVLGQASDACTREEYALCRDQHIITRMLPYYLGLSRQAQLLGLAGSASTPDPAWLQNAEAATANCLNFELQVDSQMVLSTGADVDAHTVRENVSARVPMPFNLGIAFFASGGSYVSGTTGPAPLNSVRYEVAYPHVCASVNSTAPVNAGVMGMLGFTAKSGGVAQRAEVQDFYLTLPVVPNGFGSSYSVTLSSPRAPSGCDQPATATLPENWVNYAYPTWLNPFADPTLGMAIGDWRIVGGDVMATKEFTTRSEANATEDVTVSTQMVLFHKPAP